MPEDDAAEYSIGYKKPPRHTQFKPGHSGNARGRPKKTRTWVEILMKELLAPVAIFENGKRKRVSKLEAMLKQHINKAAGGDVKAVAMILNVLRVLNYDEGDNLKAVEQQFRAIHAHHVASERRRAQPADEDESKGNDEQ